MALIVPNNGYIGLGYLLPYFYAVEGVRYYGGILLLT